MGAALKIVLQSHAILFFFLFGLTKKSYPAKDKLSVLLALPLGGVSLDWHYPHFCIDGMDSQIPIDTKPRSREGGRVAAESGEKEEEERGS